MSEETKRAILKKALDKMGAESLVLRLDTPMAQIQSWLNGQETMPAPKFLMLVDILGAIDETLPYGRKQPGGN
jgi:hypothetical protein